MNRDEAKFLLRARRPGGRDAGDPLLAEAQAEAERDPKLKAWLEREERFDAVVAGKLAAVMPPADLRGAILAGARASERKRLGWRQPVWLAAAAAVALLVGVVGTETLQERRGPGLEELGRLAMRDLADAHAGHSGRPAGLGQVQARLAETGRGLRGAAPVELEELRRSRCRALTIAGREVFEICFQREGVWYHLYATRGRWGDGALRELAQGSGGRLVAAAWSDTANSYALVTSGGVEALRRVL